MGISGDPGHNHWDGRFPAIILAAEFVYCLNFTRSYEIYGLTVTATLALTCTWGQNAVLVQGYAGGSALIHVSRPLREPGKPGSWIRARTSQLGNGEGGFSELMGAYDHPVNLLHRFPPTWTRTDSRMPLCLLHLCLLHPQESNVPIPRKWYPTSKYNPPGSRKTCPYKAFLSEHELRTASVEPITSEKSMPAFQAQIRSYSSQFPILLKKWEKK